MQKEGLRITDLAARVKITKQSMSTLVYLLEEWGYLERRPDRQAGRAVRVYRKGQGSTQTGPRPQL